MTWRELFYIHPGFLAGSVLALINFSMGLVWGIEIGRKQRR